MTTLDNIKPKPGDIHHQELFPGTHITIGPLPVELGFEINKLVSRIEKDNFAEPGEAYNNNLAGHIKKEFKIPLEDVSNEFKGFISFNAQFLNDHIPQNNLAFKVDGGSHQRLQLDSFWVNFQAKHEFNPPHNHSGMYSFVIWNRIPYDVEEEHARFSEVRTDINEVCASSFCFLAPLNNIVQTKHMHIGKDMQNYICMFPSTLTHCVFPFYTSDEYRVSLSGNIYVK